MFKRRLVRQYLLALLHSDQVPQNAECDVGLIWTNCDGERPRIYDSDTHQVFENKDGEFNIGADSVGLIFNVSGQDYSFRTTEVDNMVLRFTVEFLVEASSGKKRVEILDTIQLRFMYRMLNKPVFTDASTSEELKSFMTWVKQNTMTMSVSDDTSFDGNYTVRELSFTLQTNECIRQGDCGDTPLCFDFTQLPDGGC